MTTIDAAYMNESAEAIVLIACGSVTLALTHEQFNSALQRGRDLLSPLQAPSAAPAEPWLDGAGMEQRTGVPASWWAEQARRGTVPHVRAGRYVRFLLSDAVVALAHRPAPSDLRIVYPGKAKNAR